MKKDHPLEPDNSSHFSDLELELRKLQPSMPGSLRLRQDEIHFQLGYQTGKEYARKWQYCVWVLALVTITSWMAPGMLKKQQSTDMAKDPSADQKHESVEKTILTNNQSIYYSEFNNKFVIESGEAPETSKAKAINDPPALPSTAFQLFALIKQLNPPEVSNSTGAYSEYRDRVMIIGTDALPEFKMASNNASKKDTDSQEDPKDYTKFKNVKWSSILF